jgi:hypothetical protein
MLAYAGIYSIMNLIAPKVMVGSAFQAMTGEKLESVQNAGYLKILLSGQRNMGLFALTTVISGFFVLFAGFRKAEKWAWWAFLVVGGLAWLWGLINAIIIGDKLNIPMELIGTVLFLVGLLLPVKVFFVREAEAV